MDEINKKYDIKLEVLTPLSIGAGAEKDWVRGVDFVVHNNKAYKLSLKKLVQAGVDIEKLSLAFAKKDEREVISLITERHLASVADAVYDWPVRSNNDVKSFVKNQLTGKPVLVGSSLKGSIRSILFDHLRQSEDIDKKVFGSSTAGDEYMRFIKCADAEFEETILVNTKIFNLQGYNNSFQGGWKHDGKTTSTFDPVGFNTYYECIEPKQVGFGCIMLSNQFSEINWNDFYNALERTAKDSERRNISSLRSKVDSKRSLLMGGLHSLFSIVNAHTKAYLDKEKTFFTKYNQAGNTNAIIESIDSLLGQIPSDDSYCILKMSAGSGFHSITGDWQFNDYTTGPFDRKRTEKRNLSVPGMILPKSRKIALWKNRLDLMGFVKISVLSEAEIKSLQEKRLKEMAELEAQQRELAEKERREQEAIEKQKEEYQRKVEQYEEYCLQAKKAFENKQWKDVLLLVEKAVDIFPNMSDALKEYVEIANFNETLERTQMLAENARQEEEEDRRLKNQVPLSDKIANVSKMPTLFGNLKQWMKQNNRQSLSEEELSLLRGKIESIYASFKAKEQVNWKSRPKNWSELSSLLGQVLVDSWIEQL